MSQRRDCSLSETSNPVAPRVSRGSSLLSLMLSTGLAAGCRHAAPAPAPAVVFTNGIVSSAQRSGSFRSDLFEFADASPDADRYSVTCELWDGQCLIEERVAGEHVAGNVWKAGGMLADVGGSGGVGESTVSHPLPPEAGFWIALTHLYRDRTRLESGVSVSLAEADGAGLDQKRSVSRLQFDPAPGVRCVHTFRSGREFFSHAGVSRRTDGPTPLESAEKYGMVHEHAYLRWVMGPHAGGTHRLAMFLGTTLVSSTPLDGTNDWGLLCESRSGPLYARSLPGYAAEALLGEQKWIVRVQRTTPATTPSTPPAAPTKR